MRAILGEAIDRKNQKTAAAQALLALTSKRVAIVGGCDFTPKDQVLLAAKARTPASIFAMLAKAALARFLAKNGLIIFV
jgi:hypothetical protein